MPHEIIREVSLNSVPDGIVCIGNIVNPSPERNFLVFEKQHLRLAFIGTQSRPGGFVDFTPYVNWMIPATEECVLFPNGENGCEKLPDRLRGSHIRPAMDSADYTCHSRKANGYVFLLCADSAADDATVNDLGGIVVMKTHTETLWY
ncbi:hypothetical protein BV898_14436 [Hypsibius exemplaris]|uniref:Uncharacterized protein n=1 Tax=Hypsibius exemplaris TaxID=2072580 RepID=A0A9X6NFM4_HYPEX|nr:hypothetical protein BV898_14436 [Hypsibius exemplaris]